MIYNNQMKLLFITIITILLLAGNAFASQDILISFDYPSYKGDFYVSGKVFFPPGVVSSHEHIIVKSGKLEIPAMITVQQRWPDNSILSVEILFAANSSRREDFLVSYGEEVRRKKLLTATAVLPTIQFFTGGVPKISENIDIDVGKINVRVDRSSNIYYYWHLIPIVILIFISYIRARRIAKI